MKETISFSDFEKLDIRVAEVLNAEEIEGSDKLIRLGVSFGGEEVKIIAGIKKAYSPADLVGKQIVVVANLEPRKIMGEESRGMLLAVRDDFPILIVPEKKTENGLPVS